MKRQDATHRQVHVGQSVHCNACDQDSVVKKIRRMDGWNVVGESFACALCGTVLADVEANADASGEERRADDVKRRRLAALLGADEAPDSAPAQGGKARALFTGSADGRGDTRFCRDCQHYIRHPFLSRCVLTNREVEPMQDCERFARRVEKTGDGADQ